MAFIVSDEAIGESTKVIDEPFVALVDLHIIVATNLKVLNGFGDGADKGGLLQTFKPKALPSQDREVVHHGALGDVPREEVGNKLVMHLTKVILGLTRDDHHRRVDAGLKGVTGGGYPALVRSWTTGSRCFRDAGHGLFKAYAGSVVGGTNELDTILFKRALY